MEVGFFVFYFLFVQHRPTLAIYVSWLSVSWKTMGAVSCPQQKKPNSPLSSPLFAEQVETCLISFLQDDVQTANSNRLFCLFTRRCSGLALGDLAAQIVSSLPAKAKAIS